jgi:hypothetical protein
VYFLPLKFFVAPAFVHTEPAFGVFAMEVGSENKQKMSVKQIASLRFTT